MRIQINVDGYTRHMDSRDPETVGRWLLEVFTDIPWTPATLCEIMVYPSWSPMTPDSPHGTPDWITNAAFWRPVDGKTPEQFVAELGKQLADLKESGLYG